MRGKEDQMADIIKDVVAAAPSANPAKVAQGIAILALVKKLLGWLRGDKTASDTAKL